LNIGKELKRKNLDSIICVNVLEHIQNDRQAIQNMVSGLVDGGTLCLLVPAMSWLYGSLDTLDGHFRRYTKKSLLEICPHHSLKVEELYYFNFVGALGWLVKGRLLRRKRHEDENYRVMNFLIPFMSFVENHFPVPFGLSLVAVFRKI
jgi:SAM-dependent methyltransferase